MQDGHSHYIHGTHADEQRRLSRLNDLLNRASIREMGNVAGRKILDIGSGLGQFTREMARAAGPAGVVIGVERSAAQLEEAKRLAKQMGEEALVEFREGDAVDLPLADGEWGTFDVAHARFLLEHVADPLAVVKAMVRALRPGGRVILEDDDHDLLRLWPEPEGTLEVWAAYIKAYESAGRDPLVGRHLVSLLHEAGVRPRRNAGLFFGTCAGAENFYDMVDNFVGVLKGARESILSTGLLDERQVDDGIRGFVEWSRRPDAALWYMTNWAEGVKSDFDVEVE